MHVRSGAALSAALSAPVPPVIRAMCTPAFYPHRPRAVRLIQTHISYVLLAGPVVYKVKKAVRLPFLDFSTLARRRRDSLAEVRLNRRFAPGVYLGVVPIGVQAGGFRLGKRPAVEYAVRMRRLPDDRRLDALVARGRATPALAARLARHLVRLHRRAPDGPSVAIHARPGALLAAWRENVDTLAGFADSVLSTGEAVRLRAAGESFVARHRRLLATRRRQGRIRDAHGDLHAENVYATGRGGARILLIDCLEFSARLRCCDVASELAFLVMDLERRGAGDFAAALVASYREATRDADLARLLPFYRSYRAAVRAKVAALLAREPEVDERARAAALTRAREYVRLALRGTWEIGPPVLLVCAGLSGSGKSTLARGIAAQTGFLHLASDVIRKELYGLSPEAPGTALPGFYSPAASARTYAALLVRAGDALRAGRSVILDATFLRAGYRAEALRVADAAGAAALVLECQAEPAVIEARLLGRTLAGAHGSDADLAVYRSQRRFAPRDAEVPGLDRVVVRTEAPAAEMVERVLDVLWQWRQTISTPPRRGLRHAGRLVSQA